MSRPGIDYETVKKTAVKLLSQGIAPSVQKMREELGTGSNTTIAAHLKVWRDEYAKKTIHHLPANMSKELISTFEVLWQTAMDHAQNQLAEYKKAVENECEIALQKEKDSEKAVTNFQLKLEELACTLEQEIADKQKLSVELAVTNDRLIKQEEALAAQKNQYEDRLKRVYEEKDILLTQHQKYQNEFKNFQDKSALQSEQYQSLLAQQNTLYEQSENRWLKLLDQAKQENKHLYKKMENITRHNEDQMKKLKDELMVLHKNINDKDIKLKITLEQINPLKIEINYLKTNNVKLEEIIKELKNKNVLLNKLSKSQNNVGENKMLR